MVISRSGFCSHIQIRFLWSDPDPAIMVGSGSGCDGRIRLFWICIRLSMSDPDPVVMFGSGTGRLYEIRDFIKKMSLCRFCKSVLILDGYSVKGAHGRSNLCYLICLSHLIESCRKSGFFLLRKDFFSFMRAHHILSHQPT